MGFATYLCNTNQTEDPGDEGDDIEDIEVDDPSSCSIRVAGREAADIDYLVTRNMSVHSLVILLC